MSGNSARAPQASSEDSPLDSNSSITREKSATSDTDFSRSTKAVSAESPSVEIATVTSPDASTDKRHPHFHQPETHSLQQCGSNQSGSDSGLGGCTNSISSENSLVVNATGTEQTESVIDDAGNSHRDGESGKHHGRTRNPPGRLLDDAPCGRIIDAALDNLSNNKISSGQRNKLTWPNSQLESFATKSDTRYLKDSAQASSSTKSNSVGPIPHALDYSDASRNDDAHRVHQSSRSTDGGAVSSTLNNDASAGNVKPDKIDGALSYAFEQPHCSPPSVDVPKLKSALKKPTKASADTSNRSPMRSERNVSFNQTVIVFCEEIETSSPCEFDPPFDYRDSPDCVDSALEGLVNRADTKSAVGHGCSSYDLDILSRIVGQDASKLTDEQLFALLEGSPLFKGSDLSSGNGSKDDIFIQRLRSNQSYLCHEAISDTDSESSLVVDEANSTINQTARHSETKITQTGTALSNQHQQRYISSIQDKIDSSFANSENPQIREKGLNNDTRGGKKFELSEDLQNRSAAIVSQTSMPARVRVATVENQSKRSQPPIKGNPISKTVANHQPRDAQTQQKVIHSYNQLENPTNPHRIIVKQTNIDPMGLSKPHISTNGLLEPNQQSRLQPARSDIQDQQAHPTTVESDSGHRVAPKPCSADYVSAQTNARSIPTATTLSIDADKYIHSPQSNPACHICRAIDSNRQQTKVPSPPNTPATEIARQTRSDSASKPEARYGACATFDNNRMSQNINHDQRNFNSMFEVSQQQKMSHPETSGQSCLSCREMTLKQQYERMSTASNAPRINQVPSQSQVRPIACQIVYVVDQHGNRIRALQVLRSPQPSSGIIDQTARQLIGAPVGIRLPNPSSFVGEQSPLPSSKPVSTIPSQQSMLMNAQLLERQISTNFHNIGRFSGQNNFIHASKQRLPTQIESGQRNHTIYYVRHPLGLQNLRNTNETSTSKNLKAFPDVHEIRRLDGIKAPSVDGRVPKLHTDARLDSSSSSKQGFGTTSSVSRDDSEDPSFGFSNRPAVKVVSSAINVDVMSAQTKMDRQNGFPYRNVSTNQKVSIMASQTLDRQLRNGSNQKMNDGMPNTSSMYEINHNLSSYSVLSEQNSQSKSKDDQRHPVSRDLNAYVSGIENAQSRPGKDPPEPEVAYIMNI